MIRVIVLCAVAVVVSAQQMPGPGNIIFNGPGVSPALQRYLELTQDQVARITRLNNAFRQFQGEKSRRSFQVQLEIGQEQRRETLDPMALGLRHVELEAIRREIEAEQRKTLASVQEILTPAQRTRIAALQEVLRQYPLACEAVSNNLMAPPAPMAPDPATGSFASFLLGGVPACGGITTGIIRGGDFIIPPNTFQP
jgi:hypothetical protein